MPNTYNNRILYANPSPGQCNWDIDVERNNSINASLLPPMMDGNQVKEGGLTSNAGGLTVSVTDASVVVGGNSYLINGATYTLTAPISDPYEVNFIWVDSSGSVHVTQVEPDETMVMFAIVDTDDTSVLRIIDGRNLPAPPTPVAAKKNLLINGNLKIWQRSTSYSDDGGYCCADRWYLRPASAVGGTVTGFQVIRSDSVEVNENTDYLKMNFSGATSYWYMVQRAEDSRILEAGKQYTVSLWTDNDIEIDFDFQVIVDPDDGGTASTTIAESAVLTIPAGTTRTEYTFTVPSTYEPGTSPGTTGYTSVWFNFSRGGVIPDCSLRIFNLQLEKGEGATDIEYRSYGEELALCQRFYWQGPALGDGYGYRWAGSTAAGYIGCNVSLPVTMRAIPDASVVTEPDHTNCTSYLEGIAPTTGGFEYRVTPLAIGYLRAINGVYAVSAEL